MMRGGPRQGGDLDGGKGTSGERVRKGLREKEFRQVWDRTRVNA